MTDHSDGLYRRLHPHALELAKRDDEIARLNAEIADLTRKLSFYTSYPCHWTRTPLEYHADCGHIAFPPPETPSGACAGCGRPIVVSVVEEPHDVPTKERDRA